jgi:crossover junction endodeoxyribonuclease RuvC
MRILGVDPGSRITGFGVVESSGSRLVHLAHGTARAPLDAPLAERLVVIYQRLNEVITEFAPEALAVERVFVAMNVSSALKLCHARGVALLAGSLHHVPVYEYSALQIKSSVVGYGKAKKEQVQQMTKVLLNLPAAAAKDAADALAVAICHAHSSALAAKLARHPGLALQEDVS